MAPTPLRGQDRCHVTVYREQNGKLQPVDDLSRPGTSFLVKLDDLEDLYVVPFNAVTVPTSEEVKALRQGERIGRFMDASITLAETFGSIDDRCAIEILPDKNSSYSVLNNDDETISDIVLHYQPAPLDFRTIFQPHSAHRVYFVHMSNLELPTFYFRLSEGDPIPLDIVNFRGISPSIEHSPRAFDSLAVSEKLACTPYLDRSAHPSIDTAGARSPPPIETAEQPNDDMAPDSNRPANVPIETTEQSNDGMAPDSNRSANVPTETTEQPEDDTAPDSTRPDIAPINTDKTDAEVNFQYIPFDVRYFEDKNAPLMFLDNYTRKSSGWPMIRSKAMIPERFIKRIPFKSPCLAHGHSDETENAAPADQQPAEQSKDQQQAEQSKDQQQAEQSDASSSNDAHVQPRILQGRAARADARAGVLGDNDAVPNTAEKNLDGDNLDTDGNNLNIEMNEGNVQKPPIDWDNDPSYRYFMGRLKQQAHLRYHRLHPISRFIEDEKDCEQCQQMHLAPGVQRPEKEEPTSEKADLLIFRYNEAYSALMSEDHYDYRSCSICETRLMPQLSHNESYGHWGYHHKKHLKYVLLKKKEAYFLSTDVPTTNRLFEYELQRNNVDVDEITPEKLAYLESKCTLAENEVLQREEYCRVCYEPFEYGDDKLGTHYAEHEAMEKKLESILQIEAAAKEANIFAKALSQSGVDTSSLPREVQDLAKVIATIRQHSDNPSSAQPTAQDRSSTVLDPEREEAFMTFAAQSSDLLGDFYTPSSSFSSLSPLSDGLMSTVFTGYRSLEESPSFAVYVEDQRNLLLAWENVRVAGQLKTSPKALPNYMAMSPLTSMLPLISAYRVTVPETNQSAAQHAARLMQNGDDFDIMQGLIMLLSSNTTTGKADPVSGPSKKRKRSSSPKGSKSPAQSRSKSVRTKKGTKLVHGRPSGARMVDASAGTSSQVPCDKVEDSTDVESDNEGPATKRSKSVLSRSQKRKITHEEDDHSPQVLLKAKRRKSGKPSSRPSKS